MATNLSLQGAGTFTMAIPTSDKLDSTVNNVANLSGNLNAAVVNYTDVDDLTITGITATANSNLFINSSSSLTVNNPIQTGTGTGGTVLIGIGVVDNSRSRPAAARRSS